MLLSERTGAEASANLARNTMGAGQALAQGSDALAKYPSVKPVQPCSCGRLAPHSTSNGIMMAKISPSVFTARGTGNSPWKRQAFQSRVEKTFQTHQLNQSPDVHPHHCARPMCVSERFLETLRFLEHPSEDLIVCDAGPRGNAVSVSMGFERVCREFETIHQPSAADQLASSLALGKEHPAPMARW